MWSLALISEGHTHTNVFFLRLPWVKSSLAPTEVGRSLAWWVASPGYAPCSFSFEQGFSLQTSVRCCCILCHTVVIHLEVYTMPMSNAWGKYLLFFCHCQLSPPIPSTEARKGPPLFCQVWLTKVLSLEHSWSGNCLTSFVARLFL